MAVVSQIESPKTQELRELYSRLEQSSGGLGVLNVFKVMAHSPELVRSWLRLATLLLTGLELPPRLRELAILRVFQLSGGHYGFAHHVRIGRQSGLEDEDIASLRAYVSSDRFSDVERRALRYTDAITALADDAAARARELKPFLSQRQLVELTFCIAHWNMLARFLQPLEVEVDPALLRDLPAAWREWM